MGPLTEVQHHMDYVQLVAGPVCTIFNIDFIASSTGGEVEAAYMSLSCKS
jgi:hypothetical protein